MNGKKFTIITLAILLVLLIGVGSITVYIDPFFHFHKPLGSLQYPLTNQRYVNDGILRQFEYDAIITGSSMTENFKASEFDQLFGTNSVKVCCSGSGLRETAELLKRGLKENPNLRYALRSLDSYAIEWAAGQRADFDFPDYLYDESLLNDMRYIFNKDLLFDYTLNVLSYTESGHQTPDFDSYSSWMAGVKFGKAAILRNYVRSEIRDTSISLSEPMKAEISENIKKNVVDLAKEYPDTQFYLFFPPYSAYNWDKMIRRGMLDYTLDIYRLVSSMIVECENIHLFDFSNNLELIGNPDNYKDISHYGDWINTYILECMKEGKNRLTKDNYQAYYDNLKEALLSFDYDNLYLPDA